MIGGKLHEYKNYIDDAGAGNSSRTAGNTFDRINDNGEYANWAPNFNVLMEDPKVVEDEMVFSGGSEPAVDANNPNFVGRWKRYQNAKLAEFVSELRNGVLSIAGPQVSYSLYQVTAKGNAEGYDFLKKVNSGYTGKDLGCLESRCYYPTTDFYPRWPQNWSFWSQAWHGLRWFEEGRPPEIARNDRMMSPFVSAGWSPVSEDNQTPSQYLGELKLLMALGSEFFYSGYFTLGEDFNGDGKPDFGDSRLWAWQALAPSYAQAAFSPVTDLIRKGELLTRKSLGDWDKPNYRFATDDPRVVIYVRKLLSKYLIVTSIQPSSNVVDNIPLKKTVNFELEGRKLRIETRKQGSVYVYDTTNPDKPTMKLLDGWHETGHFLNWKKTIAMEAENSDREIGYAYLDTRFLPKGEMDFETTVRFKRPKEHSVKEWLHYSFQPVGNPTGQWNVKIKAKTMDSKPAAFFARILKEEKEGFRLVGNVMKGMVKTRELNSVDITPFGVSLENSKNYRLEILPIGQNLALDKIEIGIQERILPMAKK